MPDPDSDPAIERDARLRAADRRALVRLLPEVSRPLCAGAALGVVVSGLLPPAFSIATGAVVGSVPGAVRRGFASPDGRRLIAALAAAGLVYLLNHVLQPVAAELGEALGRRVDESLTQRVMRAVSGPAGIGHLEDPVVLDAIAQAQGTISGYTPGYSATQLIGLWGTRLMGATSLVIVGRFRWWLAAALAAVQFVSYRAQRWHWHHVTLVLYGRTDALRRSYYLRSLALSAGVAKETRVFALAPWLVDRYRTSWLTTMIPIWRRRREGAVVALVSALMVGAVELAALTIAGAAGARHAIGLGTVVVVAQSVFAISSLGSFSDPQFVVEEGARSLHRVRELEDAVDRVGGVSGGSRPPAGMPATSVRFEDVTFAYPGRDELVFDGLDLEIRAGGSLAIVGSNGAGKTTLVKLLARMYDPGGGRITADGVDLRELDPSSWQRRVAAIFQDFVMFQLSARDNVAFGSLGSHARVEDAARRAGALGLVEGLSHGWDTILSREYEEGANLSGGEWQRVALARAMHAVEGGAGILVLDEPTASLDVRGEAELYDRFLEVTRGVTTIVISHRFSTVRRADRIVVLEHGKVVEDGTHDELVRAGGRYARMYSLQAARFWSNAGS